MNRWLLVIVTAMFLAACAVSEPVPEDRFYQLDRLSPDTPYATPVISGGLQLDYTQADPLRSGRAVLYSDSEQPLQLRRYHYAFWVDQPPRLVHQALIAYLRELNVADRVVSASQRGQATYRLQTQLLQFEQWRRGKTYGVELVLQASLQSHPEGDTLWTRIYKQSQPANGNDMHASAAAMNLALGRILAALGSDLGAVDQLRR